MSTEPDTRDPVGGKTKRGVDRRHWAAKVGIAFRRLKDPRFRALYPFESRLHSIGRWSYHYLDEGEGEPVVMVHGNPTWSFYYRNLVKGLRNQYRCLVPDHMGCGLSEKPKRYDYTLERHIINIEDWLEGVLPPPGWNGGRINMIVHDWGGPIGLGYAARHPERIRRLVVLNSWAFASGTVPQRIRMCRWPVVGEYMVRRMNLFAVKAAELCTVKPLDPLVRKYYLMPYNSWNNRIGINGFVRDIPLEPSTPTRRLLGQIEKNLSTFSGIPVLIQWGMKDWCFTSSFLNQWKRNFTGAEVDEYPDAGHYVVEDALPKMLPRLRGFLESPAP